MKIKTSKKKFYNKYDFKITLGIAGCDLLRYSTVEESKKYLENGKVTKFYFSEARNLSILENKQTLKDLCTVLLTFDKDRWQKRVEGDCIDLYSNDISFIDSIKDNFVDFVTVIYEPPKDSIQPFTMHVKQIPDNRYRYRVFLLPHKLKNNLEEKEKYISWIKSQNLKIKISASVERWFMKTDYNWDPRYVLVDEESTLLMLKLRNPEIVGRIYKFVTN